MGLTIKQIRGAAALARGATDTAAIEAAGVARATFYGWKKKPEFNEAVQLFTAQALEHQAQLAAAVDSQDDVAIAYQDEVWTKQQLKALLDQKIALTLGLLNRVEPEDISPRQLPQLIQGITQLIESFRTSNDRIAGLENLIYELSKIEEQRAKNVVALTRTDHAAAS